MDLEGQLVTPAMDIPGVVNGAQSSQTIIWLRCTAHQGHLTDNRSQRGKRAQVAGGQVLVSVLHWPQQLEGLARRGCCCNTLSFSLMLSEA